jgi:hypothetical protein
MGAQTSCDYSNHTPRDHSAHGDREILAGPTGAENLGQGAHSQRHISQLAQSRYFRVNHDQPPALPLDL